MLPCTLGAIPFLLRELLMLKSFFLQVFPGAENWCSCSSFVRDIAVGGIGGV